MEGLLPHLSINGFQFLVGKIKLSPILRPDATDIIYFNDFQVGSGQSVISVRKLFWQWERSIIGA
jgi:hypothetical protein